jgi:hypothetical protein
MMSPSNDSKRTTASGSAEPAPSTLARPIELPVGRAFLVQLASDCDPAGDGVRGRVEHVRTGEAARFQSLPELVTFMLGVLKQTSNSPA